MKLAGIIQKINERIATLEDQYCKCNEEIAKCKAFHNEKGMDKAIEQRIQISIELDILKNMKNHAKI